MTQLSGVAAAVENQRYALVLGQITLHLIELAVRKADGARNMAFLIFGAFGPRIDNYSVGIGFHQLFDHTGLYRIVVAGGAFPFGKTVFK